MLLLTGLAAGTGNLIAVFAGMVLGPHIWWALIPAAALFLWKGCRPWNQPRWFALIAMVASSLLFLVATFTTGVHPLFTAAFAFLISGATAFTFADTVNGIGEGRFLPVTQKVVHKEQRRAYRRRALHAHMLHNSQRATPFRSLLLRDIDRPPVGVQEWDNAVDIAASLNERSARRLRRSWNELIATGRPLDTISAVIAQTDKDNAISVLTSDIPDEYLTAAIAS